MSNEALKVGDNVIVRSGVLVQIAPDTQKFCYLVRFEDGTQAWLRSVTRSWDEFSSIAKMIQEAKEQGHAEERSRWTRGK